MTCIQCGKNFIRPKGSKRVTCGDTCATALNSAKHVPSGKAPTPCANSACTQTFLPQRYHGRVQTCCSIECSRAYKQVQRLQQREAKRSALHDESSRRLKEAGLTQPPVVSDKKIGTFSWREANALMGQMQSFKREASNSQDYSHIELGDGSKPILLATLSDTHFGAWSADHDLFENLTDELLNTDNLYVALLGDLGHYAIKLRSVMEVSDNLLPPEMQTMYMESWLQEIYHKVAFATWDNHQIIRSESQAGESSMKKILADKVIYGNGIAHIDIKVGGQVYKACASHRFRGGSMYNPTHAQMRYMRFEGIDRELCLQGDTHTPGMNKYTDGAKTRVAINSGSTQLNSGYGKRFFSLTTHPVFPCVELYPDKHLMVPYWSVAEWLEAKKSAPDKVAL